MTSNPAVQHSRVESKLWQSQWSFTTCFIQGRGNSMYYCRNYQITNTEEPNRTKTTLLSLLHTENKWKCYYSYCCQTGSRLSHIRHYWTDLFFFFGIFKIPGEKRLQTSKGRNLISLFAMFTFRHFYLFRLKLQRKATQGFHFQVDPFLLYFYKEAT